MNHPCKFEIGEVINNCKIISSLGSKTFPNGQTFLMVKVVNLINGREREVKLSELKRGKVSLMTPLETKLLKGIPISAGHKRKEIPNTKNAKYTFQDVLNKCDKLGMVFLHPVVSNDKIYQSKEKGFWHIKCFCGRVFSPQLFNFVRNKMTSGCSRHRNNSYQLLLESAEKANCILIEKDYFGLEYGYSVKCKKCNTIRPVMGHNLIYRNSLCSLCLDHKRKDGLEHLAKIGSKEHLIRVSKTYKGSTETYTWSCSDCWYEFNRRLDSIVNGAGCPRCRSQRSKAEIELYEFVKSLYPNVAHSTTGLLNNELFELDLYIASLQKAIEFDGEYYHSDFRACERDGRKDIDCENKGISLMRIGYNSWTENKELAKNQVKEFLTNSSIKYWII